VYGIETMDFVVTVLLVAVVLTLLCLSCVVVIITGGTVFVASIRGSVKITLCYGSPDGIQILSPAQNSAM
jgi:hypothetical protein